MNGYGTEPGCLGYGGFISHPKEGPKYYIPWWVRLKNIIYPMRYGAEYSKGMKTATIISWKRDGKGRVFIYDIKENCAVGQLLKNGGG